MSPQARPELSDSDFLADLCDDPELAHILGVQPQSVDHAPGLSEPVQTTLEVLRDLLAEVLPAGTQPLAVCGERP